MGLRTGSLEGWVSGWENQIPAAGSGLRTCGVGTLMRIRMGNGEVWNSGRGQDVEVKNPGLLFPAWGTLTNYFNSLNLSFLIERWVQYYLYY